MGKIDRQLAQLFKRAGASDEGIQTMPEEYIEGWYAGHVAGREAQRKADIEVARCLVFRGSPRNKQ